MFSILVCKQASSTTQIRTEIISRSIFTTPLMQKKKTNVMIFAPGKSIYNKTLSDRFLRNTNDDPRIYEHLGRKPPPRKCCSTNFFKFQGRTSLQRIRNLQSIFYSEVRDILTCGELGKGLASKKVQLTRVRVVEDLKGLHLYYTTPTTSKSENTMKNISLANQEDSELEQELKKVAIAIRRELFNRKLTSVAPPILFKRDWHKTNSNEVEALLMQCRADEKEIELANKEYMEQNEVSYEDDSELKFVLFEHGDTKITSEVDIFADNFDLELCAEPTQDIPELAACKLDKLDMFGLDVDRIMAGVETLVKAQSEGKFKINDLSIMTLDPAAVSNMNETTFRPRSEILTWSQVYAKRLRKNHKKENKLQMSMEQSIIEKELSERLAFPDVEEPDYEDLEEVEENR